MSTCSTAKRRRRQAKNGYKHIAPLDRPHYRKRDVAASVRKLAALIERQKIMASRGKKG